MPRTKRHRGHPPAARSTRIGSWKSFAQYVIVFWVVVFFAVAFFSDARIPLGIKLIPLVGVIALGCYVLWSLGSYLLRTYQRRAQERDSMPDRRRRREGWEFPDQPPADKMTTHLEHGETPYLGDDGEIYFKKQPKHTKDAQDQ